MYNPAIGSTLLRKNELEDDHLGPLMVTSIPAMAFPWTYDAKKSQQKWGPVLPGYLATEVLLQDLEVWNCSYQHLNSEGN